MKKLLYPFAALAVTALLYFFAHIGIGWSALIAFIGWPVGGTMITADDDLPGGWSNPDGKATPHCATAGFWGQLLGGGAVVCIAFLAQLGFAFPWPYYLIPAAALSALSSFVLLRRAHTLSHHAG